MFTPFVYSVTLCSYLCLTWIIQNLIVISFPSVHRILSCDAFCYSSPNCFPEDADMNFELPFVYSVTLCSYLCLTWIIQNLIVISFSVCAQNTVM